MLSRLQTSYLNVEKISLLRIKGSSESINRRASLRKIRLKVRRLSQTIGFRLDSNGFINSTIRRLNGLKNTRGDLKVRQHSRNDTTIDKGHLMSFEDFKDQVNDKKADVNSMVVNQSMQKLCLIKSKSVCR
jgi:hypothetical protein